MSGVNSIENRLRKLLLYLAAQRPDEEWAGFVTGGEIDWSRIAVGGHSQGAGMAAFIGKRYGVARVALWSGPNDYMVRANRVAPWLGRLVPFLPRARRPAVPDGTTAWAAAGSACR